MLLSKHFSYLFFGSVRLIVRPHLRSCSVWTISQISLSFTSSSGSVYLASSTIVSTWSWSQARCIGLLLSGAALASGSTLVGIFSYIQGWVTLASAEMLHGLLCPWRPESAASWTPLWCNCLPVRALWWFSYNLIKVFQFHLIQGDWFKEQLEFFIRSSVRQTPDHELGNLLVGVVLVVEGEQVEDLGVLVDGGKLKRGVRNLFCCCPWVKPADEKKKTRPKTCKNDAWDKAENYSSYVKIVQ